MAERVLLGEAADVPDGGLKTFEKRPVKRRLPVKTAMVGLLIAPVAVAQQNPADKTPGATPDPTGEAKPADPGAPAATMTPVRVTGSPTPGRVVCPVHGSRFDMCTGEVLDWAPNLGSVRLPGFARGLLATGRPPEPVKTYAVEEDGGKLYLVS